METESAPYVRELLAQKLTDSLGALPAAGTQRRITGPVALPGKATAVIGPRRAGKTTFLHQLRAQRNREGVPLERLPFINFEDERLAGMQASDLQLLIEEYYRRFPAARGADTVSWYFDEIQTVPGWEQFVRRLLDSERVEIFLSGSSAALLSREVATSMRGRGWEVVILPFSFAEYLAYHGYEAPQTRAAITSQRRSELEHLLLQYLEGGGFPEIQRLDPSTRHELLRQYVDVAMLRDVVERHRVTNLVGLRWLVRHMLANPGGSFSVEKFHSRLKSQGMAIARDTIHQLVGHLEDCFLVRTCWLDTESERRRMVNPRKIYPVDPGLIAVFDRTGKANRGLRLETAVRVELERRRAETFYVRTREGYEVDFLAYPPAGAPLLIQVCAELDDAVTMDREVRALLGAAREYPEASLNLVTLTPESASGIPAGIAVHSAVNWLLGL